MIVSVAIISGVLFLQHYQLNSRNGRSVIEAAEKLILGNDLASFHRDRWKYPVGIYVQNSCEIEIFDEVKSYIEEQLEEVYFSFAESASNAQVVFNCDNSEKILMGFTQSYLDFSLTVFPDEVTNLAHQNRFPVFQFDPRHPAFGVPIFFPFECNYFLSDPEIFKTCDYSERTLLYFIFSLNIGSYPSNEKFGIVLEEVSHAVFLVNDYEVDHPRESIFNTNYMGPMKQWSNSDLQTIKFIVSERMKEVDTPADLRLALEQFFGRCQTVDHCS